MVVALATSGCSRAVVIPREQVAAEEYRKPGSYRIRLHGWNEYYAKRFSMTDSTVVTDSTLVISVLSPADPKYRLAPLPITVRLDDVDSMARLEGREWTPLVVLAVVVTATVLLYLAFGGYGGY
jgi:hypothetical protein